MNELKPFIPAIIAFLGGALATLFTYKGTVKNNQASVDKVYTEGVTALIDELKVSLAEVKAELKELKQELTAKDELIQLLRDDNAQLSKEKEDYKQWCREKDLQIEKMKEGKI